MRRPPLLLVLAAAAVGAWFFLKHFEIQGVRGLRLTRRGSTAATASPDLLPVRRTGERIRVATFNVQVLGTTKLAKPHVVELLARILRNFDVVAVQEIRAQDQDILPQLVDAINATDRHFDYVIGPRLGHTHVKEQYAFVFDRASLEIDRAQLYTVQDPEGLLHRPPLVGWFRVRGPASDQAFTFTLVNVHTDPDVVAQELLWLDDVFRLVREDGRGEDDVIILGDFNADDQHLGPLALIPGMTCALTNTPTNTRRTQQLDNLVFQLPATSEYMGAAGVLDFLREYNLSLEDALEISDHLPVWAEFSVYEGGGPGTVATREVVPRR